jgi:hypothetical protein
MEHYSQLIQPSIAKGTGFSLSLEGERAYLESDDYLARWSASYRLAAFQPVANSSRRLCIWPFGHLVTPQICPCTFHLEALRPILQDFADRSLNLTYWQSVLVEAP